MIPHELIDKAERAEVSARLLLESGDIDGASNRAYYAMFSAARAALLAQEPTAATTRTHNGLIAAFSLHLVKTGRVSIELGRILNRAEELRLIADYQGDSVELEQVIWIVECAGRFVQAMKELVHDCKG